MELFIFKFAFGCDIFIAYKIKEKIDFKNLCKKIIEDIKDDLRSGPSDKNGRRTISEKDFKKYIILIITLL